MKNPIKNAYNTIRLIHEPSWKFIQILGGLILSVILLLLILSFTLILIS